MGTITNNDGEFSIKVKNGLHARQVEVSHIGYLNGLIPVNDKDILECTVLLEPNMNTLSEVIIRAGDPRYIVEEAIEKVNKNYITTGSMLTGFYRETAQKGRRYINISEAVIDVYKTPYKDRNVERDRVQIYKGRKLLSEKAGRHISREIIGEAPNLSVYVDGEESGFIARPEYLTLLRLRMEESGMLNDRPHYVIRFQPQAIFALRFILRQIIYR